MFKSKTILQYNFCFRFFSPFSKSTIRKQRNRLKKQNNQLKINLEISLKMRKKKTAKKRNWIRQKTFSKLKTNLKSPRKRRKAKNKIRLFLFSFFLLFNFCLVRSFSLSKQTKQHQILMQVNELSEAFAKTSCSCIEDWDYEQDDNVKVSYTLNRRLRIWWMKLKMKIYELIY